MASIDPYEPSSASAFYERLLGIFCSSTKEFYRAGGDGKSYADLLRTMKYINGFLCGYRNQRIALLTEKSFEAYAAIYSILLSGNCWVPLDPEHPEIRILDMVKLVQPTALLTDRKLPIALQEYLASHEIDVVFLKDAARMGPETSFANCAEIADDDLAYVMFTSGSTGVPKGVPMSHRNIINFVEQAIRLLPLKAGDVYADYHDFGFDLSVVYLFCCPLSEGAIAPALSNADRILPVNHLLANEVTVLVTVPSLITRLMVYGRERKIKLPVRLLLAAGESFRLDQLKFAFDQLKIPDIFNFYGLTETGVENFYHRCAPSDVITFAETGMVPMGKPLAGNQVHISGESELFLSGNQVMNGYLGGVGKEKFVIIDGLSWFRTGDRVSEQNGIYFCHGRFDSQVKLNGYRVELSDIEANLRQIEGINEVVCFVAGHGARRYLGAAFLGKNIPDAKRVFEYLSDKLPAYMIPKTVFEISQLPLNRSGKVDRRAVEEMLVDKK